MTAALPYLVTVLESRIDSGVMSYSSELLHNKITLNEDGGFAYRINDLNIAVIHQWLEQTPFYMWLFGDGISITHGVLSFTFCCTGIIGFIYFLLSHVKIVVSSLRGSSIKKYVAFLVFVFFFNDIVTNSRFIIGVNTLLYMGILAYLISSDKILKEKAL